MHLIVFCDGTWNTPDQIDDGLPAPTNVVKLRNALTLQDKDKREQRTYYHPGVGADGGWWNRVAGGGLGEGLDKNIMSAYNWLGRNYEVGAEIWLFGFSRGAYTVRSLGGMISRCGLLDARASGMTEEAIWSAIEDLFANYRLPEKNAEPVFATTERPFHEVKMGEACKHSIRIHFIGVWDTVGAVGVPDDLDFGPFNQVSNLVAHLKVENFHFIPPTNYLVPARQHYLWYPLKRIDSLAVRLECLVQ